MPQHPNQIWSADFVSDALYAGKRFRTFVLTGISATFLLALFLGSVGSRMTAGLDTLVPLEIALTLHCAGCTFRLL